MYRGRAINFVNMKMQLYGSKELVLNFAANSVKVYDVKAFQNNVLCGYHNTLSRLSRLPPLLVSYLSILESGHI